MKKYHQLMLLIISSISLSLFLIYRHEYNRLHYVLEVFNFFGQPCNFTNLYRTENVLSQHDWGPQPLWQEHESSYTYSAFLTKKNEAKAISLLKDEKFVPRNCFFWYEGKTRPVIGKFKYSRLTSESNTHPNLYFYLCSVTINEAALVPYAISFSYKNKKDLDLKKIMLVNSFQRQVTINNTICITPAVYNKRLFVEFLSYHKLIGIDSFIFYNRDIPYHMVKFITNISTRLGFQVGFLPWNYPKSDTSAISRIIIENDCFLRSFAQSLYSVTLDLNEYIVPQHIYNFDTMLKAMKADSKRISLPVERFCILNTDASRPISVVNIDVVDDINYNDVRYINNNNNTKNDVSIYAIDNSYASIHKYVKCILEPSQTREDKSMLKFATDLVRSTMFQLMLHNQI